MSSTLLLPGADLPLNDPIEINERIGDLIELIVDAGPAGIEPTSVVDLTGKTVEILREGRGDLSTLR
jgi:tRNA A37 threonylcarbamoyladenosine synthetase subunit TsaC/SUA5/YrdC